MGGLLGGGVQKVCWPPISNYWGACPPGPPSSYAYVSVKGPLYIVHMRHIQYRADPAISLSLKDTRYPFNAGLADSKFFRSLTGPPRIRTGDLRYHNHTTARISLLSFNSLLVGKKAFDSRWTKSNLYSKRTLGIDQSIGQQ